MLNDEEINKMIDSLVMKGLIEVTGIDGETGEFLYKISDALYQIVPDFRQVIQETFVDQIYSLWIKGMVNMDATLKNPIVSLTDEAFDEEKVAALTVDERHTLFIIMNAMRQG